MKQSFKAIQALCLVATLLTGLSQAQVRRHAIVELATGQTCRPCVDAMRVIEVAKHRLGDSLIVLEFDAGGMSVPGELDFYGPNYGRFAGYYGVYETPAIVMGLRDFTDWAWSYYESDSLWVFENVTPDVLKPSPVDFRIVNESFDPTSDVYSADLDVFPLDKSSLPTEDTCDYLTAAMLTEEDLVDIHFVPYGNGIDSNFHQHAAVRAIADDSASGVRFNFGTRSAEGPHLYRRHITIEVPAGVSVDQLRVKAFVGRASHTSTNRYSHKPSLDYFDANQGEFITRLPEHAPDSLWMLYPNRSTRYPQLGTYTLNWSGSELGIPVTIDATMDNGSTWTSVGSTSENVFTWTIPKSFGGATVQLRVSRTDKPSVLALTPRFTVDPDGTLPHVAVLRPSFGETVRAGSLYQVELDVTDLGPARSIQYSSDDGAHWNAIGKTDATSILWSVPNINASNAFVRVVNGSSIDTSFIFSIAKVVGAIEQMTVDKFPTVPAGSRSKVLWLNSQYIGDTVSLGYSLDSGQSWNAIGRAVAVEQGWQSMTWSVPDTVTDEAMLIVRSDRGAEQHTPIFSIVRPLRVIAANDSSSTLIRENPVRDRLTIELPSDPVLSVSIVDVTGKSLLYVGDPGSGEFVVPTASLPNGSYTVVVRTAKEVETGFFIKE